MTFDVTPLIPVIGTVAAALVAGGIARANLIASKETKISEFRQTWIDSLREDLAALFSNTRTLTRAVQEFRAHQPESPDKFQIDQAKIPEVRHGVAETYHRIRLRLNQKQQDHKELLSLLSAMMAAQQTYMNNKDGDVAEAIGAVERAAEYAEGVLKSEWETVKAGEPAYKAAVRTTTFTLVGSLIVLAGFVVGIPIYVYSSVGNQGVCQVLPAQPQAAPAAAARPAASVLVSRPPASVK